jgi:hypothetical protein
LTAYDAETGKQAWRFHIVPGDPSKPFEKPGDGARREDVERRTTGRPIETPQARYSQSAVLVRARRNSRASAARRVAGARRRRQPMESRPMGSLT